PVLGMQVIKVLRQAGSVMLSDGKHNGLAWSHPLARGEFLIILPGKPIKFCDHLAVGILVGPLTFKLHRVVVLLVNVSSLGKEDSNARGKFVGDEIALLKGSLNGICKVWLTVLTLIEMEGIALDIICGCGREANVQRVEVDQGCLPGAVNRAVTLV